MKISFFKKAPRVMAAALSTVICLTAVSSNAFAQNNQGRNNNEVLFVSDPDFWSEISALAEQNTEFRTVVSAETEASVSPLYADKDYSVLYQDDNFTLGISFVGAQEMAALENNGEATLIYEEEYVEGDYRYVDKIYYSPVSSPSRSIEYYDWWGTHEVYYELKKDPGQSMHLGTMKIEGRFILNPSQNSAIVDDDSVKCTTTKIGSDTYPQVFSGKPTCESDLSAANSSFRYAKITYSAVFYKADGVLDLHTMSLTVNSQNIAKVECDHSTVTTH